HHVEAIAIAGEIHQFELGGGERRRIAFGAGEANGIRKLLYLQDRTEIEIKHRCMDTEASRRRLGETIVLAPTVRDPATVRDHPLETLDLALHRNLCGAR